MSSGADRYGTPSTKPPTEPGWYFFCERDGDRWIATRPAEIAPVEGGLLWACDGVMDFPLEKSDHVLWWPIPIEVPEVPK